MTIDVEVREIASNRERNKEALFTSELILVVPSTVVCVILLSNSSSLIEFDWRKNINSSLQIVIFFVEIQTDWNEKSAQI